MGTPPTLPSVPFVLLWYETESRIFKLPWKAAWVSCLSLSRGLCIISEKKRHFQMFPFTRLGIGYSQFYKKTTESFHSILNKHWLIFEKDYLTMWCILTVQRMVGNSLPSFIILHFLKCSIQYKNHRGHNVYILLPVSIYSALFFLKEQVSVC